MLSWSRSESPGWRPTDTASDRGGPLHDGCDMTSGDDHGQEQQWLDRRRLALQLLAILLFLALFLFLPAGTLHWVRGWLFFLIFLLSAALAALYLWRVNPEIFVRLKLPKPCTA
jgi:hypothetical protein